VKIDQIVSVLDQIAGKLDKALGILTIVLLGIMAVVANLGVFYRYVLIAALPWSEEIPKYCMIWMGFIGASMAIRRNQHIGFNALIERLPSKPCLLLKLVGNVLILFFLITLIKWGFFLAFSVGFSSATPMTHIPYIWLLLVVPVAGILMAVQLSLKILFSLQALWKSP
jgi:TRAP-type C4-dicarboxylate transport system permease small subunit